MQCPETSAPSPSKIQNEVNSALPTSSKRRRLVSAVRNDFKTVEVDGEHRAICNHCLKNFQGQAKVEPHILKITCQDVRYTKWRII